MHPSNIFKSRDRLEKTWSKGEDLSCDHALSIQHFGILVNQNTIFLNSLAL